MLRYLRCLLKKYIYEVKLNGESVFTIENKQVTSFENVKMYLADPWYEPVEGKIRNLSVTDGAVFTDSKGKTNC